MENWNKFVTEEEAEDPSTNLIELLKQAWENTSEAHLAKGFGQRSPGGAGSTFDEGTTLDTLKDASWQPFEHKYVRQNPENGYPKAFKADIGGVLGMLPVSALAESNPNMKVRFQPAHMGQAKTPDGETVYEVVTSFEGGRPQMNMTTLLIGPKWYPGHAKDDDKPVIWTFYPGEPTPPPNPKSPRYILEKDITKYTTDSVDSGFKDEEGNSMAAYIGTIGDAAKLGYGNIKHVEGN
tara:strand:+ start:2331 stop:3041 length:711 start_codon:yes stop_codon:yes gene_type:complete